MGILVMYATTTMSPVVNVLNVNLVRCAMRNPNPYGEFSCADSDCNWLGAYYDLFTFEDGDKGCPWCKDSDIYECCPFCGDSFDEDTRYCAGCREIV